MTSPLTGRVVGFKIVGFKIVVVQLLRPVTP